MKLELSEAVKNEVSSGYKQFLKSDGKNVIFCTVPFRREEGLKFNVHNAMTSVLVPLDSDLIASLTRVENFIKDLVSLEKYKPLWLRSGMFVNVSKWCKYELVKPDGTTQPLPENIAFGAGIYKIYIGVSHLYVGPHRGGEHYSLSLHVMKIAYEPLQNLESVLVDIMNAEEPPCPPPSAPPMSTVYLPVTSSSNVIYSIVQS